jgi:hypothetical protein
MVDTVHNSSTRVARNEAHAISTAVGVASKHLPVDHSTSPGPSMNFPEHEGTSPTPSYETTSPSTNIGPFTDEEHAIYIIQRVVHGNTWPDYNMSGRTPDQIEAHATHPRYASF